MTLLLSLLSDPSIIDRKNHTVLESCIKLVVFSSNNTNLLSRINPSYSNSGIIPPVLKPFFPPECRQTTRSSAKRAFCWFTTLCESYLIKPPTSYVSYQRIFLKKSDTLEGNKSTRMDETEVISESFWIFRTPFLCDRSYLDSFPMGGRVCWLILLLRPSFTSSGW